MSSALIRQILGIKTAQAAPLPKAKDRMDVLARQIAQIEGYTKTGTLADRQANPGNLRYVGQKNAVMGDKRFAKFNTHEDGWNALRNQIALDASRNLNMEQFIYKYAPPNQNNTAAYLQQVLRAMNANPSTKLSQAIK